MHSIMVDFDVPAEMADGTVLRANVYRPSGVERAPVLLTRLPYGKDLPLGTAILDPVQAARRGYVVVVQDTRGRFASGGEWFPMRAEADDGRDTVAWAAQLPGADGSVGMYGASYFGFTQWAAASRRPPALKALVPTVTWADPGDGLVARGGAFELGVQAHWTLTMGMDVLAKRHRGDPEALGAALHTLVRDLDGLGAGGYASLPLHGFAPHAATDVAIGFADSARDPLDTANPVARAANVASWRDRIAVPTLNVGGWYDIFLAGTLANYRAMRAAGRPAKLVIGPWTHGMHGNPVGEMNFGFASQTGLMDLRTPFSELQLRWFDHWLRGRDTGIMNEPPVQIFVMGRGWRHESEWPLERAETVPHYLHQGGRLDRVPPREEPPDRYDYDPADPVPTLGGATLLSPEYRSGPYDQRRLEARPDVLTYTSEELASEVEVTGPIEVRLWAVSSAPDTDFVARLCDVYPDGRSITLNDGVVRARHRDPAAGPAGTPIQPGRPYEYAIDLWATSSVFRTGHRIRLDVTSSNFPRWDRNPNTGHDFGVDAELAVAHQRILHDREHPSHVLLPVVPGERRR